MVGVHYLRIYFALLKSPVEFWVLVTKAGQFQLLEEIFILYWGSGQDASLSYKRVAICLPIGEGQVYTGAMKMFRELFSKLHFSERKRKRVY